MPDAVIRLALCKCDKGSKPKALVAALAPACINGQIAATIDDTQFTGTFGHCEKLDGPCKYSPAASWLQPLNAVTIGGHPPLVRGAKLACVHEGWITVIDAGQSTVCIDEQIEYVEQQMEALRKELKEIMASLMLDAIGAAEPTPFADSMSMLLSLKRKEWLDAGLSFVSVVPYFGDAASKPIKGGRAAKKLNEIRRAIMEAKRTRDALKRARKFAESDAMTEYEGWKTLADIEEGIGITEELDRDNERRNHLEYERERVDRGTRGNR